MVQSAVVLPVAGYWYRSSNCCLQLQVTGTVAVTVASFTVQGLTML